MDIQPENLQPEGSPGEMIDVFNNDPLSVEILEEGHDPDLLDLEEEPEFNQSKFQDYLLLFSIASTVVALDQFTKWLVRVNLDLGRTWRLLPELRPHFRVVHWHNTGAAFGLFEDGNAIFTILAIVVTLAIVYYYPQIPREDWAVRIALGLQMGGALGNFVDRVSRGSVTDWISFWNFPVFNVADASISIGVVFLLVGMWLTEEGKKVESPAGASLSLEGEVLEGSNLEVEEDSLEIEEDLPHYVDTLPEDGPTKIDPPEGL